MILIAFVLVSVVALAIIAATHNHHRMNTVCIAQAVIFTALASYLVLFRQVPVVSFLVGGEYFFIDHFGIFEVLIATVIFTCAAVYSRGYVEGLLESGELEKSSLKLFYMAWVLLLLVIVLAFISDNLALFWIFAEMTTIISAMLIAILAARDNIEAAIKYIFIASVSMLFAFVGFIFLFEISRVSLGTGTLNWTVLMQHAATFSPGMMIASFVLVFIGFAAKSGIFPFHTWLPEAHAKAPSAVSAILSGILLNVGIYGIIRMYALVHQTTALATIAPLLAVFGLLTIGIAAFSMLPQKNLKKMVAFSSIENMGILLVGLAISTPVALFWVLFHILAHSLTKASLFFSSGILHRQYRSRFSSDAADEIKDVFRYQPLAAWGIILGGLAIIGMPPFPIFFTEFFIMLQLGTVSLWALCVMIVLLFIAAGGLGYFVITSFTHVSEPDTPPDLEPYRAPASMKVPIIFLLALLLIIGIFLPAQGMEFLNQIVTELKFS
ncbi:MAG: proton-conducting transporter membrane subunit [Methanomicrobiales archaeon]